jgi:hypothetical protein
MRLYAGVGVIFAALLASAPTAAQGELAPGIAQPKTAKQEQMLEVIERWEETYNTDVEKMIKETYAPDANVVFTGASAKGHEQFLKLEKAIVGAAPGRKMRIDRILFSGDDIAIVEAVELDTARPDFFSPWCAILTFRDRKIVQDHTYLEPERWPGIGAAKGIPTPGGLGAR